MFCRTIDFHTVDIFIPGIEPHYVDAKILDKKSVGNHVTGQAENVTEETVCNPIAHYSQVP